MLLVNKQMPHGSSHVCMFESHPNQPRQEVERLEVCMYRYNIHVCEGCRYTVYPLKITFSTSAAVVQHTSMHWEQTAAGLVLLTIDYFLQSEQELSPSCVLT